MKLTLTSTDHFVTVGGSVARVWTGHTERGTPCHALILSIAVPRDVDNGQFELELVELAQHNTVFPAGFRP